MKDRVGGLAGIDALGRALDLGGDAAARGAIGSSPAFTAAGLATAHRRPIVVIYAHTSDAEHAADELASLGLAVVEVPAIEALPGEGEREASGLAERIAAIRRIAALENAGEPFVVVGSIHAFMQRAPSATAAEGVSRRIAPGDRLDPSDLVAWLADAGFRRVEAVEEPGDFAQRGGIIDVFPTHATGSGGGPVRLDFFGDEVDRLAEIDAETLAASATLDAVELVAAGDRIRAASEAGVCLLEHCPANAWALLIETMEVGEQARGYYERVTSDAAVLAPAEVIKHARTRFAAFAELNQYSPPSGGAEVALPIERPPDFSGESAVAAVRSLAAWTQERGARAVVPCATAGELSRLGELIAEAGVDEDAIEPWHASIAHGFAWGGEASVAVLPMHELLGRAPARRRSARLRAARTVDTFLEFAPGDAVVHADHGIARFVGLTLLQPSGSKRLVRSKREADLEEYLTLEFAGNAHLHVPCTQIDLVQKYVGGFSGSPPLSQLGGQRWKSQKQRVADSVRDLAGELLRVRAAREAVPGIAYPADTTWQKEFEAEFPYTETEDQLAALQEIKRDMASPRPMDRLICGDVGFGKTEVAVRAAFKAVEFGKQVAVLVPTTVLAEQHERTFRERFAAYPFRVESISRFKTTKTINATLRDLRKGQVDAIIGTHRLLSKDVRFGDLGLVIVDEEQRFGVEHKESLLRMRTAADVLTLSATPIPRTLHMAMLGLRDISSLSTPPVDRQSVVTEVVPFDRERVSQAIARELSREGQCFFLHNRVHDIRARAAEVQSLAPDARIVVGHGQMPPRELEEVMLKFVRHEADILVCTTIIESGIDLPNVNTIFVAEADNFGLADLHQLRGRVGRGSRRGYCYLLLPEDGILSAVAKKRLAAVEQYSMLGAGFKIAMRDLEIRGAGNLLGAEQSGHIAAVGYDMYCRLLDQTVRQLGGETAVTHSRIAVDLGIRGYIPKAYIPSDMRRMDAYRRLALAASDDGVADLRTTLAEAYGEPPAPVERLLTLAELRVAMAAAGASGVAMRGRDVVVFTPRPEAILERLDGIAGTLTALAPKTGGGGRRDADTEQPLHEVYWRPPESYREPPTLVEVLRRRLAEGAPVAS
ncbi:MAG: transcription-repair coupling factor [Planctomycetota bacterium]